MKLLYQNQIKSEMIKIYQVMTQCFSHLKDLIQDTFHVQRLEKMAQAPTIFLPPGQSLSIEDHLTLAFQCPAGQVKVCTTGVQTKTNHEDHLTLIDLEKEHIHQDTHLLGMPGEE
jgi:hypothetical protein